MILQSPWRRQAPPSGGQKWRSCMDLRRQETHKRCQQGKPKYSTVWKKQNNKMRTTKLGRNLKIKSTLVICQVLQTPTGINGLVVFNALRTSLQLQHSGLNWTGDWSTTADLRTYINSNTLTPALRSTSQRPERVATPSYDSRLLTLPTSCACQFSFSFFFRQLS